jgi:hypothetical protein
VMCYPGGNLQSKGEYFDVYHFDAETLSQPMCYQSTAPTLVSPAEGAEIYKGEPLILEWDTGGVKSTDFSINIEQNNPDVYWIETEDVFQTNGWYSASDFTTGYSGTGFLLDNWDSGEAQFNLTIEEESEYRIWVRSYKRRYNDQQNFITINGHAYYFSGNDSPLDQWVWESVGTLNLPAGELTLGLGRLYGQDEMFSVFIDAILVTADLQNEPGEYSVWHDVLSVNETNNPLSTFMVPEVLQPGKYRWSVRVFDGERLVDSVGIRGIAMPYATFTILP